MIMDYEKAYKEALERAQKATRAGGDVAMDIVQYIFPELAESEDERIRKAIVLGIKRCADAGSIFGAVINNEGVNYHDVLAYLEKQKEQKPQGVYVDCTEHPEWYGMPPKEQKPAEWKLPDDFEEAVYKVANFISPFNSQEELRKVSHRFAEQLLDIAKKDEQKQEWGEEDEKDVAHIIRILDDCYVFGKHDLSKTDHYNLVKFLCPSWKPSEVCYGAKGDPDPAGVWKPSGEQIGALNYAYCELFKRGDVGHNILGSLQKLIDQLREQM